jgi:hypothetical protein
VKPGGEWEFKDELLTPALGAELPDVSHMNGLVVECRNELQFAVLVKAISDASTEEVWAVDGDGVVWRSSQVDPDRFAFD